MITVNLIPWPKRAMSDNRYCVPVISRTYPLLLAPLVCLFAALLFPLPPAITPGALPQERSVQLIERVLVRLEATEKSEPDPWMRDDIRIAWITTLYASQGNRQPHIDAMYRVLGLHPDKVWPAILRNREVLLGRSFGLIDADGPSTSQTASNSVGELSPKKPCASERRFAPRKKAA